MSTWKDFLLTTASGAEVHFDRLKNRLFGRLDADKPYKIVYYRGFGSPSAVWLKGRVLRERDLSTPSDNDRFWQNLLATYQRFESDEVPGVTVRVEAFDKAYTTVTDEEGYFEVTINPPDGVLIANPGRVWFPVRYSLDGLVQPTTGEPVEKEGYMMISPQFSQFGVISDIDDTVLVTGATSLLQTARLTFLGNAYTRLPFAGVAAFYRALQSGPITTLFNPIYYVSSSPWNLYDLLIDFFRIQGIPKGPILLRDLGFDPALLSSDSHHTHKLAMIRKVLDVNPQLPFVLIGDSGQQDPEIYTQVVRENPGRIRAIYIRDVTPETRDASVRELIRTAETSHVPMLLVTDTVAAAEHAASLGLIDSDTIPEIRADRQADKE
ncbi:App1 family protein [Spirosoma utsteinense]|uniref:Phosphatidate phosphatase APP1 n=1 Tax=Spirosoma utsteinense TaxID=2585773 RepID=A0ABR6W4W7_9BACT|nr:phosphatase domain-containing protein [Spirosoma utsteinense]MBC3785326.1 phosphatidate phosphatase APP1 [Spirosoma utsteinense]MBC3791647.1 phosphatidate phosphatase APP1 [Spirosoma utsteinense]